jgi:hypothetical protein
MRRRVITCRKIILMKLIFEIFKILVHLIESFNEVDEVLFKWIRERGFKIIK